MLQLPHRVRERSQNPAGQTIIFNRSPAEHVPSLRGGDDDVSTLEQLQVSSRLTCRGRHWQRQLTGQASALTERIKDHKHIDVENIMVSGMLCLEMVGHMPYIAECIADFALTMSSFISTTIPSLTLHTHRPPPPAPNTHL
jgi:hypothetical protein